jgi:hypothetical protein
VVADKGFAPEAGRDRLLGIRESLTLMRLALEEFEATGHPSSDALARMARAIEGIDRDLEELSQRPRPCGSADNPMDAEGILRDTIARVGSGLSAAGIAVRVKPSRGAVGVDGAAWRALCLRVLGSLSRGFPGGEVDFEILPAAEGPLLAIDLAPGTLRTSARIKLEGMENVRLRSCAGIR